MSSSQKDIKVLNTLIFGSDHAGYCLKERLKTIAAGWGYVVVDQGTRSLESVDYPDFINPVVEQVRKGAWGILVCGSGIGMSIGANRFKGIRAALCHNQEMAKIARQHNDANILVLGGRYMSEIEAIHCLESFLNTPFEQGRHLRRIEKLDQLC